MRVFNKIIVYMVVAVLCVGSLFVPANAATSVPSSITNVFPDDGIFHIESLDSGKIYNTNNYFYVDNSARFNIVWYLQDVHFVDSLSFTFECNARPSQVIVASNGIKVRPDLKTYDGIVYFCDVPISTYVGSITMEFFFTNPYTGPLTLASAFSVSNDGYSVPSATFVNQALLYFAEQDKLERQNFEAFTRSLPFGSYYQTDYVNLSYDPLLAGYFYIRFRGNDLPFRYADSVTYLVVTCGTADYGSDSNNFICSLIDSAGLTVCDLPTEVLPPSTFESTGKYFGQQNFKWPLNIYTVVVDTSGYDLKDTQLSLQYQVDPVYVQEFDDYSGYMSEVRSIIVLPTKEELPWYARFGNWINTGFNNVVVHLQSGFKSVVDSLAGIFNSQASEELNQSSEELKQSASDIGSASDSLGAVAQPDVNAGDLIGGFTDFDTGGLAILSCITSNELVTAMMVVVFTFCLAGYIFFGKKG